MSNITPPNPDTTFKTPSDSGDSTNHSKPHAEGIPLCTVGSFSDYLHQRCPIFLLQLRDDGAGKSGEDVRGDTAVLLLSLCVIWGTDRVILER